jgi:hypothetical protein
MDKPGTGHRAGMAPDAALHSRCSQDFHDVVSLLSKIGQKLNCTLMLPSIWQ